MQYVGKDTIECHSKSDLKCLQIRINTNDARHNVRKADTYNGIIRCMNVKNMQMRAKYGAGT